MKLGVLYKNGEIVNHRSLLKVLLNPILRYFGFCIATYLEDSGSLGRICFMKSPRRKIHWNFNDHNEYDFILKTRTIF